MRNTEPPIDADRSREWNYAHQTCGTVFRSKPEFCYDCGRGTIVPIEYVLE